MTINAVDPTLTETATGSSLFDGLDGEAFLTLLIAQLRYQDPMAPTDPSAMMQQTSQFANVEAIQKLNDLTGQTLGFTQFQSAATLIGREVSFASATTDDPTGLDSAVVMGVRTTNTGPLLVLEGGGEIGLLDVVSVRSVSDPVTPAGDEATTSEATDTEPAAATPTTTPSLSEPEESGATTS